MVSVPRRAATGRRRGRPPDRFAGQPGPERCALAISGAVGKRRRPHPLLFRRSGRRDAGAAGHGLRESARALPAAAGDALLAGRSRGADCGLGSHSPVLRPLRQPDAEPDSRPIQGVPRLRPDQLPAPGAGGHCARGAARRGRTAHFAGAGTALPDSDVQCPGRLRGAGRNAGRVRAARDSGGGRPAGEEHPLLWQPAVALPPLADDRLCGRI